MNQQNDLLSVGRALQLYRRGYGFNSRKRLIFFSGFIFAVHNIHLHFFHYVNKMLVAPILVGSLQVVSLGQKVKSKHNRI